MKWNELNIESVVSSGKKNGGTRFSFTDGEPVRFQIPTGRVLYGGLSEWKSLTIEVPPNFLAWWSSFENHLAAGLDPFTSNAKDNGLRIKIDPLTYFFDDQKRSIFPDIEEGALKGAVVSCIIEVSGIYYFQGKYGFTVRAYQVVIRKPTEEPVESTEQLSGFAFI